MMEGEQVQIDSLPMGQFKAARESGATDTIAKDQVEDATPPKITGDESAKEFKEKRDEQVGRSKATGVQRRIDRLVKERESAKVEADALRERLARYEGTQSQSGDDDAEQTNAPDGRQSEEKHNEPKKQRESPSREAKIEALRQRYPDFDYVMDRAKDQGMRIADEAANVLHSLDNGGDVAYLLARNDGLRSEFNKFPPTRQIEEIKRISHDIAGLQSGTKQFADKVRASLRTDEVEAIVEGIKKNPLGERIATSLARELHDLPNGPEVLKALIHDPELSRKLAGMSHVGAALELGRISARLDAPTEDEEEKPKKVPVRPLSGTAKSDVPLAELTLKDGFKKARNAGRVR